MNDGDPSILAKQQIVHTHQALCSTFLCPNYVLVENNGIVNASAQSQAGTSVIRYNSSFMRSIVNKFGSLAAIGIFAHELGHLIDFTQNPGNFPSAQREANADQYAGCAFALAGASPRNLVPFINAILSLGASSPQYPIPAARAQHVRAGYYSCRNIIR